MVNVALHLMIAHWLGGLGKLEGLFGQTGPIEHGYQQTQGRTNDPQGTPGAPLKHLCIGQGLGQTVV